jgi:nitrogen fixation NifU-like protein
MIDKLDEAINELQNEIYENARAEFGDVAFERWLHPLHVGTINDPDRQARVTGSCGDTMQIFLKFENDHVKEASFLTDGCGASTVCGSFAAELAIGKTNNELLRITGETILQILGRFPEEYRHCAFLAADTLKAALQDCHEKD